MATVRSGQRPVFDDAYAAWAWDHPRLAARSLVKEVGALRELEGGRAPRHEWDTIDHRSGLVRRWIAACRRVGICKRCGEDLEDEVSVARGIGPVCWSKFTDREQADITRWLSKFPRRTEEPL